MKIKTKSTAGSLARQINELKLQSPTLSTQKIITNLLNQRQIIISRSTTKTTTRLFNKFGWTNPVTQ
jgi:hypothetical protein